MTTVSKKFAASLPFLCAIFLMTCLTLPDAAFAKKKPEKAKKRAVTVERARAQTREAARAKQKRAQDEKKQREQLKKGQEQIKTQVTDKTNDLNELRKQINALRKEMTAAESRRANATDQLKNIEQAVSTTQRELYALSQQRDRLREDLWDIESQGKRLGSQLLNQQARLESLVYRQYMRGNPYSLQILLNGGDPNQMARDLYYLSRIGNAHRLILSEIEKLILQKQELAATTEKHASELETVEASQKKQHEKLLSQQKQRKETLEKISAQIQEQRREIGNLERDEKHLSQLIERLAKILAANAAKKAQAAQKRETSSVEIANEATPEATPDNHFANLKGSLRLPARGVVTNRFSAPRQEGSSWKGLFIRADNGSRVKSIANGRVVFADWMRGFGNLMIVDHGGNYLSIYGNNDALLKQVGETLKGGDIIASVGNSGGNPESGLYFEIRHRGQPLDPLKWVNLK